MPTRRMNNDSLYRIITNFSLSDDSVCLVVAVAVVYLPRPAGFVPPLPDPSDFLCLRCYPAVVVAVVAVAAAAVVAAVD